MSHQSARDSLVAEADFTGAAAEGEALIRGRRAASADAVKMC